MAQKRTLIFVCHLASFLLLAPYALAQKEGPRNPNWNKYYDEDKDGLLDEDPPNDLNGDGAITRMRVKNPNGQWEISSEDKRIMDRREHEDFSEQFYNLYSEGIDDDGDGSFNEDGVGGIDMNRNFPRNWGLEFEQRGRNITNEAVLSAKALSFPTKEDLRGGLSEAGRQTSENKFLGS